MVYSAVFTPKTSARVYSSNNKIYEAFFLHQIRPDSLMERYEDADKWQIEQENEGGSEKISVHYKDSIQQYAVIFFYVSK